MGLLLTPEIVKWPDMRPDGTLAEPWCIAQKRCCFTELSPTERPQHAEFFGHFAIEFDIQGLRKLGAIPVFYLPGIPDANVCSEALSTAPVAGIGQLEVFLDRVSQIEEVVQNNPRDDEPLFLSGNGVVTQTHCSIEGARDILSFLTKGLLSTLDLHAILKTASNFFYPTENLQHTGILGYYQQREWRILPNMARDGVELTRQLLPGEKKSLLELDRAFFGRELSQNQYSRSLDVSQKDHCRLAPNPSGPFRSSRIAY